MITKFFGSKKNEERRQTMTLNQKDSSKIVKKNKIMKLVNGIVKIDQNQMEQSLPSMFKKNQDLISKNELEKIKNHYEISPEDIIEEEPTNQMNEECFSQLKIDDENFLRDELLETFQGISNTYSICIEDPAEIIEYSSCSKNKNS